MDVQTYHIAGWVKVRFASHVLVHQVNEYATALDADDARQRVEGWLDKQHAGATVVWEGLPAIRQVPVDEMMRAVGAVPLPGLEECDGHQSGV